MKRLLSTSYSNAAFNLATLLLRLGMGGLMIPHGYDKLVHFNQYREKFINFLGIGTTLSLVLVIFAEFFCAMFLVMGLFTRIVLIPMIIGISVALFKAHNGEIFGKGEHAGLFLFGFLALLLLGPGKISVDGMSGR
jgi:putative oxidoreductase